MKDKNKRSILYLFAILCAVLCLWGCTSVPKEKKESQKEQVQHEEEKEKQYLILEHDAENQILKVYSYEDSDEYSYTYAMSTLFKDKYDDITTSGNFSVGKVITLGKQDSLGYLLEVKISPEVWSYENISRFSIDEEKGVFTIADTKYAITNQTMVFSNGERIAWADVSENDTLTVIGEEKKVLSVMVTKGQGTLALTNTELFEESFIQLNTNIFAIITENMEMELPEGNYTLKVANDGWGGSCEIEILRGETTTVDLDTLKGEGYKKGLITFETDTEGVTIKIDGKTIDISEPVELTYGIHSIVVEAEGYTAWEKYLNVNSKEATIEIELEEDEEEETEESEETEQDSEDTQESTEDSEEVLEELLSELLQSNIITGN